MARSRERSVHRLNPSSASLLPPSKSIADLPVRAAASSSIVQASRAAISPGFVFFHGVSGRGPLQLFYQYDDGPVFRTDWVVYSKYERSSSAPFATHAMSFIIIDTSNASVCNGTLLYGSLSVLFVLQFEGTSPVCLHSSSNDAFSPSLHVGYFMSANQSFPFLVIDGILLHEFNQTMGNIAYSLWGNSSAHDLYPLDLSGLEVAVCSDLSQTSCKSTVIPSQTVIHSQQSLWVTFTDLATTTFVTNTPHSFVGPSFLNQYYNISSNVGHPMASQLIYAAINQTFSPSDLAQYQSEYGIPGHTVTYDVNGHSSSAFCEVDSADCGEANLDVQILTSVSQSPSPTTYYYDLNDYDFFLSWITNMADSPAPPLVQSVSYGEDEAYVPQSYYEAFNTEALKVQYFGPQAKDMLE